MGRTFPSRRGSAQIPSCSSWRARRAHRANDARSEGDRTGLSAIEYGPVDRGILFHDSGKLWENQFSEKGFVMDYDELGELVGHISIGLELVNSLWRKLSAENAERWKVYSPPSEDVRLHLLHLIGSHHGQNELVSPVEPKTPEAMALHYIDNLDSKLEMFAAGYATAQPLAPRIFDRVRPLPGNLVKSLEKFHQASDTKAPSEGQLL